VVLILLLLLGGYVLGWSPLSTQLRLAMLLAELGLAIVLGCELVHIRDFMGVGGDMSRMNTVFKFYMIVWILFALVTAAALAELWPALVAKVKRRATVRTSGGALVGAAAGLLAVWAAANYFQVTTDRPWLTGLLAVSLLALPWVRSLWPKTEGVRAAWFAVLGAIVFTTAIYPPLSLYNRTRLCSQFRNPTLNGEAYLARMNPQDAKAIAWINQNIRHTDIVLEAPGSQGYNCFDTRVAVFTGQPTLIGWIGQEEQMRYNPALTGSHTEDAKRIFNSWNIEEAQQLMARYRVQYVYVGANEKKAFFAPGLEKFSRFMNTVYNQDEVTIYKVRE